MRRSISAWVGATVLAAVAGLVPSRVSAQVGRASVTGIVTDSVGAVVPGAMVRATHVATGFVYESATNEVGNYTISSLPVGEYSLTYSAAGFKTEVRSGIVLAAGQIARLDIRLEVGQLLEQVTVTAQAPLLQTETAQSSESVTSEVFASLPLAFGGRGRNMAEFAARIVPGVRGADYTMSIQGTPGASAGIVVDGMTNLAGFLPGDFAEASISAEAVQELTVITGMASAEYGRQSGGTLVFTLKSGSNRIRGSAFYTLRNEFLHANDWNNNLYLARDPTNTTFRRPRDRQKNYAGSFGGPVYLPKLYDGRNRTFFYFTAERFQRGIWGPGSLTRTVPQPEMWRGDLSRLLRPTRVGTDALGRDVFEGMIYDPSTLRMVGGRYVADPFVGNIIPPSRISRVARNFAEVFNKWYAPVNDQLTNNHFTSLASSMDARNYSIKVDHSLSNKHKFSGYFYKHSFPRHIQGGSSTVWSLLDPDLGGPLSGASRQHRRGYNWSVAHDWIAGPSLLNHARVGLNNNANAYVSRMIGKQYADQWGIKNVGMGLPDHQVTRPVISLGGSPVVTFPTWNHDANRDEFYRNIIVSNSLSWYRGSHSFKFGFEWNFINYDARHLNNTGGTFSFAARTTAIPGETFTSRIGNSFASFLLGEVNSAFLGPIFNPITSSYYGAAFVQDSWKVNRKLTFTYGLRWSGNSPHLEKRNEMATFNPNLPDPNFGGILGAVEYAGFGPGRSGRRNLFPGHWRDFGPIAGIAYQFTARTVLRTSYGISYTPEGFGWTYPWRAGFNETFNATADSKGIYRPVFNIDDGFPLEVRQPPNLDPSFVARFGAGRRYHPLYAAAGYVQNFNFGFQREVTKDLRVDLEWRGSKGTRLHAGGNVIPNQIHPRELARGAVLTRTISSPEAAAAAGLPYPYPGFSGLGAYTLLPFPQLLGRGLSAFGDPVGSSTYHSLNLIVTKRMAAGYYLYGAYTFSKTIANVSDVANGGGGDGIQDTYNRSAYKAVAAADRTHVLKSVLQWDLPVGRRKALLGDAGRLLNALVGGWRISALLNYSSGTPLVRPTSRVTPNFWNGPSIYANFNTPPGGFRRIFNPKTFDPWNAASPGNRFFDPSAFSDAEPQSLGTSPNRFPQVRGLWSWSEDASLVKSFAIAERVTLLFRLEMFNLFNRHYFGGPTLNMNFPYFGNVINASGRRTGQLSGRLEW